MVDGRGSGTRNELQHAVVVCSGTVQVVQGVEDGSPAEISLGPVGTNSDGSIEVSHRAGKVFLRLPRRRAVAQRLGIARTKLDSSIEVGQGSDGIVQCVLGNAAIVVGFSGTGIEFQRSVKVRQRPRQVAESVAGSAVVVPC